VTAAERAAAPVALEVLDELHDRRRRWQPGDAARVINLSLRPLGPADGRCLDVQVGRGPVALLSRGYGPCRIASTLLACVWRVTYFDTQGTAILDTLELADMPEVACAAREDLEDSALRLAEWLQWAEPTG
jgi:hydrogenase-1 operon protein HyaF